MKIARMLTEQTVNGGPGPAVKNLKRFLVGAILGCWSASVSAQTSENTAHVGVLAFRGADAAEVQWKHLADYLTDTVAGWRFDIVPVTLVSAPEKIDSKEIDFLITNPGHFVSLAADHPLSALATRERLVPNQSNGLLSFGTAIFTRKETNIRTLSGLKGKSLAAVSPEAFGGFQIAWDELRRQNIDVIADLESIRFMGFPQDAIVTSVVSGEADAGVVRSGLLENLHNEGRINIAELEVLSSGSRPEYPFLVTGHLYPEWPFLALPGIQKVLREDVAMALLKTQDAGMAQKYGLLDVWSAPLSYESVRQLVYDYHGRATPNPVQSDGMPGSLVIAAFIAGALLAMVSGLFISRTRNKSRPAVAVTSLPDEIDAIADLAEERTKFHSLTRRERQILSLICSGKTNKAVANQLGISPKTVEFHRANLLQKTGAGTTAQLIRLATRLELDQGFFLGQTSQ